LDYFPKFDEAKAKAVVEALCATAQDATSVLCLTHPGVFAGMHYTNADVVALVLPDEVKREIHAI
jgi:hypothetical protein